MSSPALRPHDHAPGLVEIPPASQATILIVDDAPINRRLLQGILGREGYELLVADSGAAALELARERRPDLVLLDVLMPELDGYEVCTALKQHPSTAHIPIVFLSALDSATDRVRGLECGGADYVTKPFDRAEVVARVRTQLELQRANRQLRQRQQEMEAELRAAAEIQRSLLPDPLPPGAGIQGVQVLWHYAPCESLGGDMLGVQQLTPRDLAIHLFDVSGHGVPSSLVAISVTQFLSRGAGTLFEDRGELHTRSPAAVITELDRHYPIDRFSKHLTMVYLVLDTEAGTVRYSAAAHPFPVLVRADGRLDTLCEGGTVIGLGGLLPFDEGVVRLEPGDRIFLYTDGLVEAESPAGEHFGEARLHSLLGEGRDPDLESLRRRLLAALAEHCAGRAADDDVTFLALQWDGGAARSASDAEPTP